MCQSEELSNDSNKKTSKTAQKNEMPLELRNRKNTTCGMRRGKRVKQSELPLEPCMKTIRHKKVKSSSMKRHGGESKSGGIEALLPSLGIVAVLACGIVAKMGWRGRATVAGIDLGTTNSVICVQQQSKGVGEINCIRDPLTDSPIIPSVISFLDPHHTKDIRAAKLTKDDLGYNLSPNPSYVLVGAAAKDRIDTHPHHTLYHAKRVLGRTFDHEAVQDLAQEVEFEVATNNKVDNTNGENGVVFNVPYSSSETVIDGERIDTLSIPPYQVGSYIVNHLMQITKQYLGHDNVRSAVIAIPAKFNGIQRQATVEAFKNVGIKVARILEEPVAAALAYGLQKKEKVDFIMVYDFGGGTLDVSLLQVFEGGYVEVIGVDGDDRLGGADFDAAIAHTLLESNEGIGSKIVNKVTDIFGRLQEVIDIQQSDVGDDIEELLVSGCPRLQETPLCSLSSFHTMGEKMKIELSSYNNGNGIVRRKCLGISQDSDEKPRRISQFCALLEPIEFVLTSEQYDSACESLYERSILPIRRILKDLEMKKEEIDEVVMVGGTTRMPQIRDLVKNELNVDYLNTSIDPDLTVAYGAASVID